MAGVAKTILIGNLGRDIETTYTPNGQAKGVINVAVSRKFTTSGGEKREETSWFRCILWGKLVESVGQFLVKGKQVYVEGRPANRQYEKDGVKQYAHEITVTEIQLLGSPDGQRNGAAPAKPTAAPAGDDDFSFDDVPF